MNEAIGPVERPWLSRVGYEIKMPPEQKFSTGSGVMRGFQWPDGTRIVELATGDWGVVNDARQVEVNRCFPRPLSDRNGDVALVIAQNGFGPGAASVKYEHPFLDQAGLGRVSADEIKRIWNLQSDDYFCRLIPEAAYRGPILLQFDDGSTVRVSEAGKRYLGVNCVTHLPVIQSGPSYQYHIHCPIEKFEMPRTPANTADCLRILASQNCGPAQDGRYSLTLSLATRVDTESKDLVIWMWPDNSLLYLVVNRTYPHGAWFARKSIHQPELLWSPGQTTTAQPSRWAALALLVREFCWPSRNVQIRSGDEVTLQHTPEQLAAFVTTLRERFAIPKDPVVVNLDPLEYPPVKVEIPKPVPLNSPVGSSQIKYPEVDKDIVYQNLVTLPEVLFRGTFEQACLVIIAQLQHGLALTLEQLKEWDVETIEQRIRDNNPEAGMVEYYEACRIMNNYVRFYTAYQAKFTFPIYTPVTHFDDTILTEAADAIQQQKQPTVSNTVKIDRRLAVRYLVEKLQQFKPLMPCPACRRMLPANKEVHCMHCGLELPEKVRHYIATREFQTDFRHVPQDKLFTVMTEFIDALSHKIKWRHTQHTCDSDSCNICNGGLSLCTVCGGGEASQPTHCPGRKMSPIEEQAILNGEWDFVDGEFIRREKR